MKLFLSLAISLLLLSPGFAQPFQPRYRAVEVAGEISSNATKLTWLKVPNSSGYQIWKKLPDATSWGTMLATITDTVYSGAALAEGDMVEYKIKNIPVGTDSPAYGYIQLANKAQQKGFRGYMMMVVEDSAQLKCADALKVYKNILVSTGWRTIDVTVKSSDLPGEVKTKIQAARSTYGTDLTTVFLIGRVPVPYSGNFAPDGHLDHYGAWPADVYYGELTSNWTDESENTVAPTRQENWNEIGDGKFDQTLVPSDVELAVGRADFSNMPLFGDAYELLSQYLYRVSFWRTNQITVNRQGLIDDNFKTMQEGFSLTAWRSYSAIFDRHQIFETDYRQGLKTSSYLMSYGCGAGSYTNANGIAKSSEFAKDTLHGAFTFLFGSYFGDWDTKNNFLRAPLAASGSVLTSGWSGRPIWILHKMATGATIGEVARLSQSDYTLYNRSYSGNYYGALTTTALMGDPSLTLENGEVVPTISISRTPNQALIEWDKAQGTGVLGYNVYQSIDNGPWVKLNPNPLTELKYGVILSKTGKYEFIVRPVTLVSHPAGSMFVEGFSPLVGTDYVSSIEPKISLKNNVENRMLKLFPENGMDGELLITDMAGHLVLSSPWSAGQTFNLQSLSAGLYLVSLQQGAVYSRGKILIY